MTTNTIIVAGGAGFIGLNLIKSTLTEGTFTGGSCRPEGTFTGGSCRPEGTFTRIVILDNFKTSSRKNVEKLSKKFPFKIDVYDVDITKRSELQFLKDLYKHEPIAYIYHLASIASPPLYSKYPLETLDVGYTGTKNLLDLALELDSKPRFLFASSSEVYGQPLVHPQSEDYYGNVNPYGTRSCYDESKRVGETLLWIYNKIYGVETRIVRIFNTYGPYMNLEDGRIVTEIIRSFICGNTLRIFGDGNQTRCFNYIDDTVKGIISVMKSDCSTPVNVGGENEISVNKLIEVFEIITGRRIEKEFVSIDKDDPLLRKPDLTKLKKIVSITPTSIQVGLSNTLQSFKKHP